MVEYWKIWQEMDGIINKWHQWWDHVSSPFNSKGTVLDQEDHCTAGLLSLAHVIWSHVPTVEAVAISVNWQPFKGMDMNGAQQEDSTVATS